MGAILSTLLLGMTHDVTGDPPKRELRPTGPKYTPVIVSYLFISMLDGK